MNVSALSSPIRRELLTVDLCGLQRALFERSANTGRPAAAIVRDALAVALGVSLGNSTAPKFRAGPDRIRVSLRMAPHEEEELAAGAAGAGLTLGRYVTALMRGAPEPPSAADRRNRLAALTRSNAELSTLSRNIARLAALLTQGASDAAQEYGRLLLTLHSEIRGHLVKASGVLSE
jgi:hypothetical protein